MTIQSSQVISTGVIAEKGTRGAAAQNQPFPQIDRRQLKPGCRILFPMIMISYAIQEHQKASKSFDPSALEVVKWCSNSAEKSRTSALRKPSFPSISTILSACLSVIAPSPMGKSTTFAQPGQSYRQFWIFTPDQSLLFQTSSCQMAACRLE
jgi:hypothetical protein